MRKFTPFFAVILFVIIATVGNAQTLKFGHIDLQALIQVMPDRETVETEFNGFQKRACKIFTPKMMINPYS